MTHNQPKENNTMKTPKTISEVAKVIADRNAKTASKKENKTIKAKPSKEAKTAADRWREKEALELLKRCGFHFHNCTVKVVYDKKPNA